MTESLRVAHFLPNLVIGGRERMTVTLCQALKGEKVGSIIVGYDPQPQSMASFTNSIPYFQFDRYDAGFIQDLVHLLKMERVNLIHAQGYVAAHYAARLRHDLPGLPMAATIHSDMSGHWRWAWHIRQALRRMDTVAAVSAGLAKSFGRLSGRAIAVTSGAIDLSMFSGIKIARPAPHAPFRFALLARLAPVKRPLDAIHAADRLIERGISIELHIAGDGKLAPVVKMLATDRPWLRYHGSVQDVPGFLAQMHGVLLPSRSEGTPLVLAEAMACALPLVISDIPSLREMAGEAALLHHVGDVTGLSAAMAQLVEDAELWRRLSAVAIKRSETFDIRQAAATQAQTYRGLVNQKQSVAKF